MKVQYPLIVSDFDGTLRQTKGGVSQENIRAISDYAAAGGIFALCTGRMSSSIRPYTKELGLKGLVASYQGAIIEEIESGKKVRDARIPGRRAVSVCRRLEEKKYHIHVYDGDVFYSNMDDEFLHWYQQICGIAAIITPQNISATVEQQGISPHKILVICPPEERGGVFSFAQEAFGEDFYITTSSEYLVEIVMKGSDKGGALQYLADYYGIPLERTIAIGDNLNDLPMIERAGLGVAMENAESSLKSAAGFITRPCDDGGVAHVIRKYGLGEEV